MMLRKQDAEMERLRAQLAATELEKRKEEDIPDLFIEEIENFLKKDRATVRVISQFRHHHPSGNIVECSRSGDDSAHPCVNTTVGIITCPLYTKGGHSIFLWLWAWVRVYFYPRNFFSRIRFHMRVMGHNNSVLLHTVRCMHCVNQN